MQRKDQPPPSCSGITETAVRGLVKSLSGISEIRRLTKPFKKPLAPTGASIHSQINRRSSFPFPRTESSHSFREGHTERCEAVQDGNPDLELGDLAVKVPCAQALTQQHLHSASSSRR